MKNPNADVLSRTVLDELEANSLQGISESYFFIILVAMILICFIIWADVRSKYFTNTRVLKSNPRYISVAAILVFGLTFLFTRLWGLTLAPYALVYSLASVMSLFSPTSALCLFISQSILRPWELIDQPAMEFIPKMTAVLTFLSFFIHRVLFARRTDLVTSAPVRWILLFGAWAMMSAALFNELGIAAFTASLFVAILLFMLCTNIPVTRFEVRRVLRTIFYSVVGLIAHAWVLSALRPITPRFSGRLEGLGLLGNSNDLAAMISLAIPLGFAPWMRSRTLYNTIPWILTLGVLVPGLLLSQSRATVLAVAASALIYWVGKNQRQLRRRALIACGLLPIAAVFSMSLDFARSEGDLQGSSASRLNYMISGLHMTAAHPIFGVGFNNYPLQFDNYSSYFEFEWGQRTAHSTWIQIISELGIPGFLLFVGLYLAVAKRAWFVRLQYPELFVGFAAYSISMSFLSHAYTMFPYLVFGIVCATYRTVLHDAH